MLHIATVAGLSSEDNSLSRRLEYVRLLDEVLDLFDTEPRFQHFVLDGEVGPLEDYLSIRPENFERIEELVEEGKLLIGPWYTQSYDSPETAIRSLMIGTQTADVFGRPMMIGYLPDASKLPGYLPQIFKSFDIDVVITNRVDGNLPNELIWVGDDGTQIILGQMQSGIGPIADLRGEFAPYAESGHMLFAYQWDMQQSHVERLALLNAIPVAQTAHHDTVFHSHPAAYASAIQAYAKAHVLPKITGGPTTKNGDPAEYALTHVLEPLLCWAAETKLSIQRPQYLLQQLWKRYLSGVDTSKLVEDCYQLAASLGAAHLLTQPDPSGPPGPVNLVTPSAPQFRITTMKLPEDPDCTGLVVRGHNVSDEDIWVTLTPWRAYSIIDVVTMNEEPTGGRLAPESNGAVQFRAAPHRILTFWFHDELLSAA